MRCSDSPPPVRPHFVAFVWPYHARDVRFVPPVGQRRPSEGPGVFGAGCPFRLLGWRKRGLPGSWGNPCDHALLADPGGIARTRPSTVRRCCLPDHPRRRLPRRKTFEALSHGLDHSLSTLRSTGCPNATQDSLPAAGQALPGSSHRTAGFPSKGFNRLSHAASPFPKLRLAQEWHSRGPQHVHVWSSCSRTASFGTIVHIARSYQKSGAKGATLCP